MKQITRMLPLSNESPFGINISKDSKNRLSLTDIWREAGSPDKKSLKKWLDLQSTRDFISTAERFLKVDKTDLIAIKRGKSGGTNAHLQIALEYAQYLDPRLAVLVNEVFFERVAEEKNPDLILDRAVDTYKRKGKSDGWIGERLKGKASRINFTKALQSHGVAGIGFKNCTNAIYEPLWGGDASLIRTKKGLNEGANTRESMTEVELAAVGLAELLAKQNIENSGIYGNKKCEAECLRTGKFVAQAVIQSQKNLAVL